MKQIFHHYTKWEDFQNGMWDKISVTEEEKILPEAINFTGDHIAYGEAMMEVVKNWKYSCEQKLTDNSINQRAWVGHAACCYRFGWPEYIVRQAWHCLSQEQQDKANAMADRAIEYWKTHKNKRYAETQIRINGF